MKSIVDSGIGRRGIVIRSILTGRICSQDKFQIYFHVESMVWSHVGHVSISVSNDLQTQIEPRIRHGSKN